MFSLEASKRKLYFSMYRFSYCVGNNAVVVDIYYNYLDALPGIFVRLLTYGFPVLLTDTY